MKEYPIKDLNLCHREILLTLPDYYEKRRLLNSAYFYQENQYIFLASIYKVEEELYRDKIRLLVIAYVFNRRVHIYDELENRSSYQIGKKQVFCGRLSFIKRGVKDLFDKKYNTDKGDMYGKQSDVQQNSFKNDPDAVFDIKDNCRWNRGWKMLKCKSPVADNRLGITPFFRDKSSEQIKEIVNYISQNAPQALKMHLLQVYYPTSFGDLNEALKDLFALEIACFLKYMEKDIPNQPMKLNPTIDLGLQLTPSQEIAVSEIYADLEKEKKMSRILFGDVGSGKTIVAILAAAKCIVNNKNVLYLTPTQLLSKQIYANFQKFVPNISAQLCISGSKHADTDTAKVIIGTHTLLWKQYSNVGLVIIDEQHKFGVEQREKLARNNNLLMMTATAIPRTLQLMLLGHLQVSKLQPRNLESQIETQVLSITNVEKVWEDVIKASCWKKIIWVAKSISKTEENYELFKSKTKSMNKAFIIHSRVIAKHQVLKEFDQQSGAILFATTVVEVGIDIDVQWIVIEEADQFGLAQLHQIRGRVGRRNESGVCILLGANTVYLDQIKTASKGEDISSLDLGKRGYGILHSNSQSGFSHFLFAKQWKENKWVELDVNQEISEKVKKIKLNIEKHKEILDLFVADKMQQ